MNARFSEGLDETRTNFKKGSRLSRFFSKENWLGQASTYVGGGTLAAGGVGAGLVALGLVSNPIGWVAGAIIGGAAICAGVYGLCDGYTDDEFIDDHMEALYKDLKALEQKPTLSATAQAHR